MADLDEYSIIASLKKIGWRIFISWDFGIAIIASIAVVLVSIYGTAYPIYAMSYFSTYLAVSAALLGLIVAAYAIFASFGNDNYLRILVKSGIYDEVVSSFALSALALVSSIIIGIFSMMFVGYIDIAAKLGFAITTFLTIYGVMLVAVISISSLRIVALLRRDFVLKKEKDQKG